VSLLTYSAAGIPAALSTITSFIKENPIMSVFLFAYYFLIYIYQFINNHAVDSDIYEMDLLSSGISSIMVAMLLVGLDEAAKGFDITRLFAFNTMTTKVALVLLIYGIILIIFAFIKVLPHFIVILLGNSELDLFINLVAVLLTQPKAEITGTLLVVIGVPLAVMFVVQRIRRMMG
jgi:hypothetical protein